MQCSYNEIEMTLRKAVTGAGFSVGTATEVARAGLWLCRHDRDGARAVLEAVRRPPAMISREQTTDWRFTNAQIAHVGVAAIDHVLSADRSAKVVFDNVDVALLLVGLAGDAVERTGTALQLGCDGRQLVVGPRMSAVALDLCERSRCMTLSIAQATLASETAPEPAGRININPDIWPEILELAARTYVPASDASRLRGAGAGLTDND